MLLFTLGFIAGAGGLWLLKKRGRRLLLQLRERKEQLLQEKQIVVDFMHNIVDVVIEGGSRDDLFKRIIHTAIISTDATSACIFEPHKNGDLHGTVVEGLFPPLRINQNIHHKLATTRVAQLEKILHSETFAQSEGLVGAVAQSKRGLLIKDAKFDPRIPQHEDPILKIHSLILVPILFKNKLIAILAVANPASRCTFNKFDFSLVESLAEQAGLAIYNSEALKVQIEKRKLDLDIQLARNIQKLLLPKIPPSNDAIQFSAYYIPAQTIGGDLYAVIPFDDGRYGTAIADVSGKGIPASIIMAICQTHLLHIARSQNSPAAVLRAINTEMYGQIPKDRFVTMIYAIVDTKNSVITLARAGHEEPLYFCNKTLKSKTISSKESPGMALGMVHPDIFDPIIDDCTIPFKKGDSLLLYTDGITEFNNPLGEEFGTLRLQAAYNQAGLCDAQALTETLIAKLNKYSLSQTQDDDLTLLTIKRP
jgi:sigma-B regulation protein RsbU (phosphoserine phosphatase)